MHHIISTLGYRKATPNKFSASCPPLRHICMWVGSPFPYFIRRLHGCLSSHYLPSYSKQLNSILACAFIFYTAKITLASLHADLLAQWPMSWQLHTMHKKNWKTIEEYGIMELLKWAVDRKHYLEWPNKSPHFFQKTPSPEFSGYGPVHGLITTLKSPSLICVDQKQILELNPHLFKYLCYWNEPKEVR